MTAHLISVDWGTTSFRAYLVDEGGQIIRRVGSAGGILLVENGDFAGTLKAAVSDWFADRVDVPVIILSGMIGSRQGWVEAPYVAAPADAQSISSASISIAVDGLPSILLVPGMVTRASDGRPDVMRGEETQVVGAMRRLGVDDGLMVLPGTHAKWVTVAGGAITGFETYMTGEVFAALKGHTILGRTMAPAASGTGMGEGFNEGVALGATGGSPGHLLNRIFSVRTRGLMGELAESEATDYLSGLLIGAELAAATAGTTRHFTIIGSEDLARRYLAAARVLGLSADVAPADCVVSGHLALLEHWRASGAQL